MQNTFSQVRSCNGFNSCPDTYAFQFSIQKIAVSSAVYKKNTSNCADDNCATLLESLSFGDRTIVDENLTIYEENLDMDEDEKELSKSETDILIYISGFLIKKLKKFCKKCAEELEGIEKTKFITNKEYHSGSLNVGNKNLNKFLAILELKFKTMCGNEYFMRGPNIVAMLCNSVQATVTVQCEGDHEPVDDFIKKVYFDMRIYYHFKWANERLHHQRDSLSKRHKKLSKF